MIATQTPIPTAARSAAVMSDAPTDASKLASAWTALPSGVVDGNEIIVLAIKPSVWRPVFDSAAWIVTSCLLAAGLIWLEQPIPGLSPAVTAQLILLVGGARLAIAVARWIPAWYILTNRRILSVHGVRTPRTWSCSLLEVRNTYLNTSLPEKALALGTVTFVADHPNVPPHTWRTIAKPKQVHEKIRRQVENAIDQQGM